MGIPHGATTRLAGVYRPRRPKESQLWQIFDSHFEEFVKVYEERYAETYGPLRPVVRRSVEEFLKCGILEWGFARIRCPNCKEDPLLGFSCKRRCLCPSCHKKRQVSFGEFVAEESLEAVPHRHVVLSVPRRLRVFFRRDRRRMAKLSRAAYETIKEVLQTAAGDQKAVPGAVACLQSYGNLLDWHPHAHLLISWGVFRRDGTFIPVESVPDTETLEKLFRHKVLRMLLDEGAMDEKVVANLLSWHHTGFGAHVGQEIQASDRRACEAVASYMAHAPVVLGRIVSDPSAEQVVYKSDTIHPRHGANFRTFDPLDLIAEVVSHIPDANEKVTLYYGFYSLRSWGDRRARGLLPRKEGVKSEAADSDQSSLAARQKWASFLRKVFEVDPLICRRCGSEMKIIAIIDRPETVERILRHLKLWSDDKGGRAPPVSGESDRVQVRELMYEPFQESLPFDDGA